MKVTNYEKNMMITLYLPEEVNFSDSPPKCIGVEGVSYENIECSVDTGLKSINMTKVITSQVNPGTMKIMFNTLRNPVENIVTQTFKIETKTRDGYLMDFMDADLSVNFYCEYPCSLCDLDVPSRCEACYPSAVERYFFEAKCLSECPVTFVETATNNCTACEAPCLDCESTVN